MTSETTAAAACTLREHPVKGDIVALAGSEVHRREARGRVPREHGRAQTLKERPLSRKSSSGRQLARARLLAEEASSKVESSTASTAGSGSHAGSSSFDSLHAGPPRQPTAKQARRAASEPHGWQGFGTEERVDPKVKRTMVIPGPPVGPPAHYHKGRIPKAW